MPCRGAALAAPAALSRYSDAGWSLAATREGRPSLGKGGKVQIEGEVGSGLGWAQGALPGWGPRPGPTPSRPSSSAPVLQPHPQTRASGPAALTTHPWPEHSGGLQSPSRAAGEVAARDSLRDWGCCRPLVGGGGEGRGAGEDSRGGLRTPGGGAGGGAWLRGGRPPGSGGVRRRPLRKACLARPEPGRQGSAERKEGTALHYPLRPSPEQSSPRLPAPVRKPRGGGLGPGGSRSAELGTRLRHPKDESRAPGDVR